MLERSGTGEKPTMQTPRSGRKEGKKRGGSAIPLQPMVSWQVEPLHPAEISSGEESHLQSVEDPMLERRTGPEKGS